MEDNTNITQENNGAANTQAQNNSNSIDYDKLNKILEEKLDKKENAVIRGFIESFGLNEEEAKAAFSDFKAKREEESKSKENAYIELQNKYDELVKSLETQKVDNLINTRLIKEGLTEDQAKMINKLINRDELKNDKGEVEETKIDESLNNIYALFPNLKPIKDEEAKSKIKIGVDKIKDEQGDDLAKEMADWGLS